MAFLVESSKLELLPDVSNQQVDTARHRLQGAERKGHLQLIYCINSCIMMYNMRHIVPERFRSSQCMFYFLHSAFCMEQDLEQNPIFLSVEFMFLNPINFVRLYCE